MEDEWGALQGAQEDSRMSETGTSFLGTQGPNQQSPLPPSSHLSHDISFDGCVFQGQAGRNLIVVRNGKLQNSCTLGTSVKGHT